MKPKTQVDMEKIYGYVERITFYNSENGYTVAQLKVAKQKRFHLHRRNHAWLTTRCHD